MKKFSFILLAFTICLAMLFTSCNAKSENDSVTENEKTTTEVENANSKEPEKADEEKVAKEQEESEGKKLGTYFWSVVYDEDVWVLDEKRLLNNDKRSIGVFRLPDKAKGEKPLLEIVIVAYVDSPHPFRRGLYECGFDARKYVEGNYDTYDIGGVDFIKYEGERDGLPYTKYMARVENAKVSIWLHITGEVNDDRLEKLLSTLNFKLENIGHKDAPWPWEGEAFKAGSKSVNIGDRTVTSEFISMDKPLVTYDVFSQQIAVANDKVYIVSSNKLLTYDYDGKILKFNKEIDLNQKVESISHTDDDSIWLSGDMKSLLQFQDGKQIASYDGIKNIAMHPSGTWGIGSLVSPTYYRITFENDEMKKTPLTINKEVMNISYASVDDEHIYVVGDDVRNQSSQQTKKLFVYNLHGEYENSFTKKYVERIGRISYFTGTNNGFICFDTNNHEVNVWSKEGEWLGAATTRDLFGMDYAYLCSADKTASGDIIAVLAGRRQDNSADEVVVFKLSGF